MRPIDHALRYRMPSSFQTRSDTPDRSLERPFRGAGPSSCRSRPCRRRRSAGDRTRRTAPVHGTRIRRQPTRPPKHASSENSKSRRSSCAHCPAPSGRRTRIAIRQRSRASPGERPSVSRSPGIIICPPESGRTVTEANRGSDLRTPATETTRAIPKPELSPETRESTEALPDRTWMRLLSRLRAVATLAARQCARSPRQRSPCIS